MLTPERANVLTAFLNADEARAQTLMSLDANEALQQINALGNDFTLEELSEYGKAMRAASTQGELSAEGLDDVSGGIARSSDIIMGRVYRSPGIITFPWQRY